MDKSLVECHEEVFLPDDNKVGVYHLTSYAYTYLLYLLHMYLIHIDMYKYFCHQLYDIHLYFQCVTSCLFYVCTSTFLDCYI